MTREAIDAMSYEELEKTMAKLGYPPFSMFMSSALATRMAWPRHQCANAHPGAKNYPLSGRPDVDYENEVYEEYLAGLEKEKELERQAQKAAAEARKEPESGS